MAETKIKDVQLKIGTEAQFQNKLKDLPINTLVGTTDPINEGELDTSIINKLAKADTALQPVDSITDIPTNLEYDTTDGLTISATETWKDSSNKTLVTVETERELPIVAGENVTMDIVVKNDKKYLEIKAEGGGDSASVNNKALIFTSGGGSADGGGKLYRHKITAQYNAGILYITVINSNQSEYTAADLFGTTNKFDELRNTKISAQVSKEERQYEMNDITWFSIGGIKQVRITYYTAYPFVDNEATILKCDSLDQLTDLVTEL